MDMLSTKIKEEPNELSTDSNQEPIVDKLFTEIKEETIVNELSKDGYQESIVDCGPLEIMEEPIVDKLSAEIKEEPNGEKLPIYIKEEPVVEHCNSDDLQEMDWRRNFHKSSEDEQAKYDELVEYKEELEEPCGKQSLLKGRRIIDIRYVLNWAMNMQQKHSGVCPSGELRAVEELQIGLISVITFQCDKCGTRQSFCTEDPKLATTDLNVSAVRGTISTGNTYDQLRELLNGRDVPCMSRRLFQTYETELNAWASMEEAGREEKKRATWNGQVGEDGVLWIEVYVEGGWEVRSLDGNDGSASEGVGAIIGRRTQKLLFIGVHNKFCTVCARAASLHIEPTSHKCIKNWNGPITAMEPDIIVEGFNHSLEMHGLKYRRFDAQGASSASLTSKIKNEVTYGDEVTRTNYLDEAPKGLADALVDAAKDAKGIGKVLLSETKIKEMQEFLAKLISLNAAGELNLKIELEHFVKHIYDIHTACKWNYCHLVGYKQGNMMKDATLFSVPTLINGIFKRLGLQSIDEERKNRAALYTSLLKFNCGEELVLNRPGSSKTTKSMKRSSNDTGQMEQGKKMRVSLPDSVAKNSDSTALVKEGDATNIHKSAEAPSKVTNVQKLKELTTALLESGVNNTNMDCYVIVDQAGTSVVPIVSENEGHLDRPQRCNSVKRSRKQQLNERETNIEWDYET